MPQIHVKLRPVGNARDLPSRATLSGGCPQEKVRGPWAPFESDTPEVRIPPATLVVADPNPSVRAVDETFASVDHYGRRTLDTRETPDVPRRNASPHPVGVRPMHKGRPGWSAARVMAFQRKFVSIVVVMLAVFSISLACPNGEVSANPCPNDKCRPQPA